MGYDISYHPIKEDEITALYFDPLKDAALEKSIGKQFKLDKFYLGKLKEVYQVGRKAAKKGPFNSEHGLYLAVVAGIFRKYWYIRGGAVSFAFKNEKALAPYTKPWKELVPKAWGKLEFEDRITENYMAGCYLTHAGLKKLREDYESKPRVKSALDKTFSDGRLAVFFKAMDYAIKNIMGLIEASEVIIPNPFDPNGITCYSNLHNCEKAGIVLYMKAVQDQLSQLG